MSRYTLDGADGAISRAGWGGATRPRAGDATDADPAPSDPTELRFTRREERRPLWQTVVAFRRRRPHRRVRRLHHELGALGTHPADCAGGHRVRVRPSPRPCAPPSAHRPQWLPLSYRRPPQPVRGSALRAVPRARGRPPAAPVDGGSAGRDPCVERLRLLHDLAASLLGLRLPPGTSESQEGPQGQAFRLGTGENARRARGLSIRFDVRHELVDLRPVIPLASCPPEDANPREAHRAAAGRLVPPAVPRGHEGRQVLLAFHASTEVDLNHPRKESEVLLILRRRNLVHNPLPSIHGSELVEGRG